MGRLIADLCYDLPCLFPNPKRDRIETKNVFEFNDTDDDEEDEVAEDSETEN